MLYAGAWAAGVPAAVDELTVSADPDGLCVVDVAFTTPSLTIDGEPLSFLEAIVVMRDDSLLTTVDNPPAGRKMIYIDTDVPFGRHSYSVYAVNAAGKGAVTSSDCYIGVAPPMPPDGVKAVEAAGNDGVTVSWNIPAQDINGSALSSKYLLFDIYSSIDGAPFHLIASAVKGERYNVPLQRGFIGYAVVAVNDAGTSEMSEVFYTYIGDGASMPYSDNGRHCFIAYGSWKGVPDERSYDFASDGFFSNGLLMCEKVRINCDQAALSFFVGNKYGNAKLDIKAICNGDVYILDSFSLPITDNPFQKVSIPLDRCNGRSIIAQFEAHADSPASFSVSDIQIYDTSSGLQTLSVDNVVNIRGGNIEITSPGSIAIYRIDGIAVATGYGHLTATLIPGVYILITPTVCRKIII